MNSNEILSKIGRNLEKIASQRDQFKDTISRQHKEIEGLREEIQSLELQLKQLPERANNQLQSTIDTSKNEEVKLKIDGLIEEIDECLTLLNN